MIQSTIKHKQRINYLIYQILNISIKLKSNLIKKH